MNKFIENIIEIPRVTWYCFLILILGTLFVLYKDGNILRPDMPVATQELSEWNEFDLSRLYNSQRCDELTEFYAGRVEGTEAMKNRCDIISDWLLSYDNRQKEKRLDLLANDLRKYNKENFVD